MSLVQNYAILGVAIVLEVIGTSAFSPATRSAAGPSALVVVC